MENAKEIIRKYDPDGISIDFIRHFVFWEKVYSDRDPASLPLTCFDSTCLTHFQASSGLIIPDSLTGTEETASWIMENHPEEWTDYLSPMTYAHMVKQDLPWIHSIVEDIYLQTGSKVIPSIQVNKAYLDNELGLEEFEESLLEALKPPSGGVVFWSWEALKENPDKKQLVYRLCSQK